MILMEDYSSLVPSRAGKIVGCASYRGDYILLACEYGLFKIWDDGIGITRIEETKEQTVPTVRTWLLHETENYCKNCGANWEEHIVKDKKGNLDVCPTQPQLETTNSHE